MKQRWWLTALLAACGAVDNKDPDARVDGPVDGARIDGAVDAPPDADPFVDVLLDFDASRDVMLNSNSKVIGWKDQSGKHHDATAPTTPAPTAVSANVTFNNATRSVVRFDGNSYLTAAPHVPAVGTLFLLYSNSATASNNRVFGWESFATGANGLGIETGSGSGQMYVIARASGSASGDIIAASAVTSFELDVVSWGPAGVTLDRYKPGVATESKTNTQLTAVGDGGYLLHIGSAGDAAANFHGDVMRLRVYTKQLSTSERAAIASALLMP